MKFILAVAFLAVALAAPQGDKKPIENVSFNSEMNTDGSYSFDFESADGTKVSDENGFEATSDHLPTPPPMPDHGNHLPTPPPMPDHGNHLPTPPPMPDHGNHLPTPPPMPDHGNHLPTPPPMPEHVVKMLADLKAARVL